MRVTCDYQLTQEWSLINWAPVMTRCTPLQCCSVYRALQVDEDNEEDPLYTPTEAAVLDHKQLLSVQSIKLSAGDAEGHVLLFDTEALIIQLLADEFGLCPLSSQSQASASKSSSYWQQGDLEQKITGIYWRING